MHVQRVVACLWAVAVIPAAAWIPHASLDTRSSSVVDFGILPTMEDFYQLTGLNESHWTIEEIVEYETHDAAAVVAARADARRAPHGAPTSPARTYRDLELGTSCDDRTGFAQVLCDNMPERYAYWTIGAGIAIWYGPDVIVKWANAVAHIIKLSRSLKVKKNGGELGSPRRRGLESEDVVSNKYYKFSIPQATQDSNSIASAPNSTVLNNYIFEESTGIIHYQGTKASLSPGDSSENTGSNAVNRRAYASKRQTYDYTLILVISAVSQAGTIASEECIGSVIKWHIDMASQYSRERCSPLDNQGSWQMGLMVVINEGKNNDAVPHGCCGYVPWS